MRYISVLFLLFVFAFSLSGCYVYTQEPPPSPAIIIVPGDIPPPPPPAGAVGPAR